MNADACAIVPLPEAEWKLYPIPMRYTTETYYDVIPEETDSGWRVSFERKPFETPVTHYPEEYDFPDKLYEDHWEGARAWGVVSDEGELLACVETCPESWSNRLVVAELWVTESLRRQGLGHRLMAVAKEQAVREGRRAVILETQSCNTGAVAFYRSEGFTLGGFDLCCYSNRDRERREVRLDLVWIPPREPGEIEKIVNS